MTTMGCGERIGVTTRSKGLPAEGCRMTHTGSTIQDRVDLVDEVLDDEHAADCDCESCCQDRSAGPDIMGVYHNRFDYD